MEEEHSFPAKVVRPVWQSEAAVAREAKRRSLYYTHANFWPLANVMLGVPTGKVDYQLQHLALTGRAKGAAMLRP